MNYKIPTLNEASDEYAASITGYPARSSRKNANLLERVGVYLADNPSASVKDMATALDAGELAVKMAIAKLPKREHATSPAREKPPVAPQSWLSALEWRVGAK